MRIVIFLCCLLMSTLTAECCCDNPYPSTKPPEPTGFQALKQSDTSALLKWDAVPCHQDWLIKLNAAYTYPVSFYFYTGPTEFLTYLGIETIAWIDDDSDLPWLPGVPKKVYQLCLTNGHTGEETCAPRWVGLQ